MNITNYLTSLQSFKTFGKLGTGTDFDGYISQMIAAISDRIEQYTRRKLRGRTYTEYHDGKGYTNVYTKQRPIISVTSLYDDLAHVWGTGTLIATANYIILQDKGIIQLYSGIFATGVQNLKLTYIAGYNEYQIIVNVNDSINFKESGSGSELTATLVAGEYIISDFITHIKAQMEDVGTKTYTVTYSYTTGKITIATSGVFLSLLWLTGANTAKSVGQLLGFDTSADSTESTSYTADNSSLGIPMDLELAANILMWRAWKESPYGNSRFDLKSKMVSGERAGTTTYVGGEMPPEVVSILSKYRRILF